MVLDCLVLVGHQLLVLVLDLAMDVLGYGIHVAWRQSQLLHHLLSHSDWSVVVCVETESHLLLRAIWQKDLQFHRDGAQIHILVISLVLMRLCVLGVGLRLVLSLRNLGVQHWLDHIGRLVFLGRDRLLLNIRS